tara:strand:- start:119 stop:667 length:549 start_codon:yes stop_codon:yes gene_type:complete
MTSSNSDDTVEILLEKIASQDSIKSKNMVYLMFSMTTKLSKPITFRNFSKKLIQLEPDLSDVIKKSCDNLLITKKSSFFKSKLSCAKEELIKNNLAPQANLVGSFGSGKSTPFSASRIKMEILMLKAQNVNIPSSIESLERFKFAKEICDIYSLIEAGKFMGNYVDLYKEYLKTFLTETSKD